MGTLRASLTKEISRLRTDLLDLNLDQSNKLTDTIMSAKKYLNFSGVLAAVLFAIIALFSALKIYTIEEAKRPLVSEIKEARKFESDMAKLVCSSGDGVVRFSPIFVAQFCGLKGMKK